MTRPKPCLVKTIYFKVFTFLFLIFGASAVAAGEAKVPRKVPVPANWDQLEVYLVTAGLGPDLHARYGHTLLMFKDIRNRQSYIYNWGMFSFNDPWFAYNFYLGERNYWVGETSKGHVVRLYTYYEDRSAWEQKLNLTNKQKMRLVERVNSSFTPENIYFRYEHFTRNCATVPRDFISEALGGYVKESLQSQMLEVTYRDYVVTNMNKPPFLGFLLDIGMNSKLEKRLTKWEESFYPPKLAEHLSDLPAIDDDGNPLGVPLLSKERRDWVKASSEHLSSDFRFAVPFSLAFAVLLGFCWVLWVRRSHPVAEKFFRVCFGFFSFGWGLWSGLLGLFMLISWLFSTHYDMHHNVNLLLFFTVDFLFCLGLFRRGGKSFYGWVRSKPMQVLVYLHALALLIFILGGPLGVFVQDVTTSMLYMMPIQIFYLYTLVHVRKHAPSAP